MTIFRMQCAIAADSTFPRDRIVITPHFDDHGLTSDPSNLCNDLAVALNTYFTTPGEREISVRAYEAESPPPNPPAGQAIVNTGKQYQSNMPRELAVCLSFYADRNVARRRGRLYLPVGLMFGATEANVRPGSTVRTKAGALVPILAGLGGVDVDWVVYSRADGVARKVTNWWVDDEWDVQRTRGLRGSVRLEGTTSG